ncbi:MAG TPA: nucleoside hydrolase [Anaerolineales bacterium]|nr:nucleoside hydrolase [Anaerolineales bacterium]
MIKVLLDTDIGTDVDDAICLAYLLAQPQCDLLGITTVSGESGLRAALASAICRHVGREVPIYPGAETPILGEQKQRRAQQAAALPRWPHQSSFPQDQAIDFMRETIRAYPGEVILLTIGPLTNAGLLFKADPDIPALLKGMVMMGGVYKRESPEWHGSLLPRRIEWNTSGDPLATQIVFDAPLPNLRALGLDVTQQVVLQAEQVRQRFTAPLLAPVLDFAEIWFAEFFPSVTFHDPLSAAVIFEESLCSFQLGCVRVDLQAAPGRTYWEPGGLDARHQVAVSVDVEGYFNHFFNVVGYGQKQ